MSKRHIFLRVFSKIIISVCVFCAFFISPVFAGLPDSVEEHVSTTTIDGKNYTIPSDVTMLEYASFTGTTAVTGSGVWFNTHVGSAKAVVDIKFHNTSNRDLMGYGPAGGIYFGAQGDKMAYEPAGRYDPKVRRILVFDTIEERSKANFYVDGIKVDTRGAYPSDNFILGGMNVNHESNAYFINADVYGFYMYDQNNDAIILWKPAKKNNVVGMYDFVSKQFIVPDGGTLIAGPVVDIKIATTKFVDEEFAAAEAKLATTVQTIESVVSRTISQTEQIQILQDTKQTRPDENCPANMKCLLVQDEDGTPHWYPIIEP